jgi:hypothetical protein
VETKYAVCACPSPHLTIETVEGAWQGALGPVAALGDPGVVAPEHGREIQVVHGGAHGA